MPFEERSWTNHYKEPGGYEHSSDLELAKLADAGDEDAFAEIVRRYSPRVFHFASRFFRQRSLVEEAAQEVFMKAFTQLGSYEGRGSMEGWFTTHYHQHLFEHVAEREAKAGDDRLQS